jgi:hypothetical protein
VTPAGLWRRVRHHFSIDAPRMAVRSHLPWPWKAGLAVALLLVIGGMWWWGFDFGQILGGFNRKEVEADHRARGRGRAAAHRVGRTPDA